MKDEIKKESQGEQIETQDKEQVAEEKHETNEKQEKLNVERFRQGSKEDA